MDVINAKSNTYRFVEVVIYSEILRTNCRMNQSSSHLATTAVLLSRDRLSKNNEKQRKSTSLNGDDESLLHIHGLNNVV